MQLSSRPSEPIESTQLPLELRDPNSDLVLMRLRPESDPDSLISRLDMEKIPSSDGLSQILGNIPQKHSYLPALLSQQFDLLFQQLMS